MSETTKTIKEEANNDDEKKTSEERILDAMLNTVKFEGEEGSKKEEELIKIANHIADIRQISEKNGIKEDRTYAEQFIDLLKESKIFSPTEINIMLDAGIKAEQTELDIKNKEIKTEEKDEKQEALQSQQNTQAETQNTEVNNNTTKTVPNKEVKNNDEKKPSEERILDAMLDAVKFEGEEGAKKEDELIRMATFIAGIRILSEKNGIKHTKTYAEQFIDLVKESKIFSPTEIDIMLDAEIEAAKIELGIEDKKIKTEKKDEKQEYQEPNEDKKTTQDKVNSGLNRINSHIEKEQKDTKAKNNPYNLKSLKFGEKGIINPYIDKERG